MLPPVNDTVHVLATFKTETESLKQTISEQKVEIGRLHCCLEVKDREILDLKIENGLLADRLSNCENWPNDSYSGDIPPSVPHSQYEELRNENASLQFRIKDLEHTIALMKGSRDSRTSSTSPSQDLGRSNSVSLRTSNGRKTGGQPGHASHTLPLSDAPDKVIDHTPATCACCGKNLEDIPAESYTRRQEVDIPPIRPFYTEHRSRIKTCPSCGTKNRGVFPERITAPIQYGPRIEATTGYLSAFQYVPYKRICRFFKDCFGLALSEGVIDSFLKNLSLKATSAYETIRERIHDSHVVGSDETGCRVNGKKHWFHVWQNAMLTFIVAFAHRSHQVISPTG